MFWKILLIVLLLLVIFFFEEAYRYIFCRPASALFTRLFDSKGHEPNYYITRDRAADRLRAVPHETWTIPGHKGEALKGFYYPNGANGKKIVFLIHGYRSHHIETGGLFYDYYKSRGVDFFCCDHTAHGESEGKFIGFDVWESQDCLRWIDFLREKFGDDIEICLHGFSMGGGTVLQMSSHCPAQVKFIVSDSGFPSAYASMAHQIGPLYHPLRWINRVVAGYDWNDSDVSESLSQSRLPILFVHGQDDKLVPAQCGPALYAGYQGPKDGWFPAKTRHIEAVYTQPEEYARRVDAFLGKYFH